MRLSSLKLSLGKSERYAIRAKKRVQMEFSGCNIFNLNISTIKILGVYFSYSKQLAEKINFMEAANQVEKLLRVWSRRSLFGRIVPFKTLPLSKIVRVAGMVVVSVLKESLIN